ncbi:hypothetical protein [Ilumatobacter nonamiensis]|uniref:hypothetical protein n=1 Tax=Ilumatobacter nonamiensis TaxID=467093 RepID=UPI0011D19A49|nr:hypothetical protein [Ilumatobacter nonamiensis]
MTDDLRNADGSADDAHESDDEDFGSWFDERYGDDDAAAEPAGVATDTLIETDSDTESEPEAPADDESSAGDVDDHESDTVATAAKASLWKRVGARIVRRPVGWWNRPWTNERIVRLLVTSTALTVTTVIIMRVVHFAPFPGLGGQDLILDNNTPTGGDMGAHVWAPAFLRDNFLPSGQLSGWTMDWYGGLPLYRFYMVIPALAIVALDVILPYGIAFKIVAVSGLVTFPAACWAFGRLAAFRHPIPELFAFGGLCFLLDESFEIYGGNVKSTMAGEYSFSIALTLAMLGLGLLAHGLRTGRFRVWAAVVLSLAAVSHGIVLIFVAVAALIICLVWLDLSRLFYAVTVGVTTLLLSAWWVGPFLFGHEFMTDMKYGFRPNSSTDSFWDMFFPLTPALDIIITTLAVIGFAAFVMRRQLTGAAIGFICIAFVIGVYITRDSLPVIGLLWNPRLLPFVYLTRYLLMVAGAFEVISLIINAVRQRTAGRRLDAYESAGAFSVVGVSILLVFGWMYEVLPFDGRAVITEATDEEAAVSAYAWGPFRKGAESGRAVADGWSRYNFRGYEGRPAYPAYHDLITTMDDVGQDRGCGRAIWENNSANSEYGTTMALMLLPHWTDGCIASMEGLFFEATASTNYHFLTAAAVSESSSNPVRQLRYTNNDAEVGVEHMQDLGVRYLMVRTDPAKNEASTTDDLALVGTSGTWDIYEVQDSNIVEPLTVEPVVVDQADDEWYKPGDARERNLELGTSWFQNRDAWPAIPVDDGPQEWQRVEASIVEDQRIEPFDDQSRKVDYVEPSPPITPTQLPEATVSDVVIGEESVEFSVDEVGVPVLVKVSYFPNWTVSGAEGPYRAGANQMIVIPTETDVKLSYDSHTALDWFFYLLTAIGIGLCFVWRRQGDLQYADVRPGFRRRKRADDEPTVPAEHTWSDPDADQESNGPLSRLNALDDAGSTVQPASPNDSDASLMDPTPAQPSMLIADFPEPIEPESDDAVSDDSERDDETRENPTTN